MCSGSSNQKLNLINSLGVRKVINEQGFRQTPIGKIPEDWKTAKLGDICRFKRGFSYHSNQITKNSTNIRFITINDFEKEGGLKQNSEKIFIKENINIDSEFFIKSGDVLIANTDMSKGFIIGAPILIENLKSNVVYSMDLTKLIFNISRIDNKFLFYLLKHDKIRKKMKAFAQGTNVLHLNHDLVKNIKIPLPPLPEQRKIAEILSTVDNAIQKVSDAIARTERLKKGLMQRLLTKGIGHNKFKFSKELGCEIPEEWEVVRLGDVCSVKTGPFGSQLKKEDLTTQGFKVYEQENVIHNDFKRGNDFIDPKKFESLKNFKVLPGDVLLTRVGSVGCAIVVPKDILPGIIGSRLLRIRSDKKTVHSHYLRSVLTSSFIQHQIAQSAHGATRKGLNTEIVKKFKIPLPPISEQQKIAEILSTVDKKLELEKKRKEKLERIKRGLMNDLLTGRRRVEVEG